VAILRTDHLGLQETESSFIFGVTADVGWTVARAMEAEFMRGMIMSRLESRWRGWAVVALAVGLIVTSGCRHHCRKCGKHSVIYGAPAGVIVEPGLSPSAIGIEPHGAVFPGPGVVEAVPGFLGTVPPPLEGGAVVAPPADGPPGLVNPPPGPPRNSERSRVLSNESNDSTPAPNDLNKPQEPPVELKPLPDPPPPLGRTQDSFRPVPTSWRSSGPPGRLLDPLAEYPFQRPAFAGRFSLATSEPKLNPVTLGTPVVASGRTIEGPTSQPGWFIQPVSVVLRGPRILLEQPPQGALEGNDFAELTSDGPPATRRFVVLEPGLAGGSTPGPEAFPWLARCGYRTVVNLDPPTLDHLDLIERSAAVGLRYVALPIRLEPLRIEALRRFQRELSLENAGPVLIFDSDGARVGALWYWHRRAGRLVSLDQARSEAIALGLRDSAMIAAIDAMVERPEFQSDASRVGDDPLIQAANRGELSQSSVDLNGPASLTVIPSRTERPASLGADYWAWVGLAVCLVTLPLVYLTLSWITRIRLAIRSRLRLRRAAYRETAARSSGKVARRGPMSSSLWSATRLRRRETATPPANRSASER